MLKFSSPGNTGRPSITPKEAEYMKKNVILMSIYMKSLNVQVTEQQPSYDMYDIISDLGGQMGLFLGASIITWSEILEWMLDAVVHKIKTLRLQTSKITVQGI